MKLTGSLLGLLLGAISLTPAAEGPSLSSPSTRAVAAPGMAGDPATKPSTPGLGVHAIHGEATKGFTVTASWKGSLHAVTNGGTIEPWTLMNVVEESEGPIAVFADLSKEGGRMLFVRPSRQG